MQQAGCSTVSEWFLGNQFVRQEIIEVRNQHSQ